MQKEPESKLKIKRERHKLLVQLDNILEGPMIALGFVWLVFIIIELTSGLNKTLEKISIFIWIIFIAHFILTFIIAPVKRTFLKKNILTIISLIVPAFRVLRILRLARLLRGARLVKVVGSLNRGMRSLAATMNQRGFGYMLVLSIFVVFGGAAGMYAFEKNEGHLNTYGEALWWTGIMAITVGSDYWPKTTESRILCFAIALYGFAVLGYFTATLATFFIGKDQKKNDSLDVPALKNDLSEIKKLLEQLRNKLEK